MTPLHIQIGLHYHCTVEQFRDRHLSVVQEYARDFVKVGLLTETEGADGLPQFGPTDGLKVWADAVCAVPFPVQRWVIPARALAQGEERG